MGNKKIIPVGIDDFEKFIRGVRCKEKMVAIAAPAVAANFPKNYLRKIYRINFQKKTIGIFSR